MNIYMNIKSLQLFKYKVELYSYWQAQIAAAAKYAQFYSVCVHLSLNHIKGSWTEQGPC